MRCRNIEYIRPDETDRVGGCLAGDPVLAGMDNIRTVDDGQTDICVIDFEPELVIGTTIDSGKSIDLTLAEGQHTDHYTVFFSGAVDHRHGFKCLFDGEGLGEIKESGDAEGEGAADGSVTLRGFLEIEGDVG